MQAIDPETVKRSRDFFVDVVSYRQNHDLPKFDWQVAELPEPNLGEHVVFYSPVFGVVPGYLEQIRQDGSVVVVVAVPGYGFDSDKPVRCTFPIVDNGNGMRLVGKYMEREQ